MSKDELRLKIGDLVLLVTSDNKRYLLPIQAGKILHTHHGKFQHDDLVGQHIGSAIKSQLGHMALIFEPTLHDLMHHIRRGTQIVYPKDAVYLIHRLGLRSGSTVVEAGTGSGALTTALAWTVAPAGRVYTYESRHDTSALASKNLKRFGLLEYVELFVQSAAEGFQQQNVDALVLDLREPWRFLEQVLAALRPGGCFACFVPTTNQVSQLLSELESGAFADTGVEELLLRSYKPVPDRLRPEDDMVGHTGYMVFARAISTDIDQNDWLSRDRKRYLARQKAQELSAIEAAQRKEQIASGGAKYPKMPLPD